MSQSPSRQQRRAEQRAAAKRPERVYEIELRRTIDDDEGGDGLPWWGAECGFENDSVGIDIDSDHSLQVVVDGVLAEARRSTHRWRMRLRWTLHGRGDVAAHVAKEGVRLPEWA